MCSPEIIVLFYIYFRVSHQKDSGVSLLSVVLSLRDQALGRAMWSP